MKCILPLLLSLISYASIAQTQITGTVTNKKNEPIVGANIYLEGTYDGTTTLQDGTFNFTTTETGTQILVISYVGYETFQMASAVSTLQNLKIQLRDDINALETVVLSAGTFSAGDNSKVSALTSMDVVTTASALGDFVGALQTLPGTTTVAEDGRLFVRGGEANETQIFIDGIRVFTPYTPTTNNIPTRGRYSPFLFDGITFSTGGYSAEYGQALSSVLLLNTFQEPDQNKTEIRVMSVGAGLGNTQKWDKSSLSINASYINLAPYTALFPDRNNWQKPYENASGEAVFRQKTNNGLLKLYTAFDTSNFQLTQEDINFQNGVNFKLNNSNLYFNGSYKAKLKNKWRLETGVSYTHAKNNINIEQSDIDDTENSIHAKLKFRKSFSNRFKLNFGAEYFNTNFNEAYQDNFVSPIDYGYKNNISAAFTEADVIFSKKVALKAGFRVEYSELFKETTLSPRASLAYKTGARSQVSFAYGDFYQNPNSTILKFNQNLKAEKAQHFILNYQYNSDGRIFRAETYYKQYDNLVKYDSDFTSFEANYNSNGSGFAKGLDFFYRDNKSIKNIDYWVSYSFLDTKRDYRNYPVAAQPNFANKHNVSIVGKYWINKWKSQVGLSYAFASGRTYTNPNQGGFLNQKTKSYNSLSLNWAYLLSQQKILYFSVNNVLGFKNINGYQYANTPDVNNNFARQTLRPAADQFFFVGFFWTISDNGTDNQLNDL
ncbi:TonB-dependent receptor [Lacinutrix sp. MedPE-SW]|uniref:TonB-dependent receptor n=1 Tax=Lacinutrix sp. MedPE-SW TaxID=1860087 RepID=UPI00090EFF5E|nr:TonB-dependent receptor [Lacinutrix sp. MedPE-SW]OIQ22971.1 MAG: TonB-dependent receptor [Lacinutrix sp. MedPE-SW]